MPKRGPPHKDHAFITISRAMKSYRLFRHSLRQVTGNFSAAVRLSIPYVIFAVLGQLIVTAHIDNGSEGGRYLQNIVSMSALIFGLALAVNWHRHILLEEPAVATQWMGRRVWAYFLRSTQMFLVMLLLAAPLLIWSYFAIYAWDNYDPEELSVWDYLYLPAAAVMGLFLLVCWTRLSVMLPAAALGRGIGVREVWRHTGRASWAILGLWLLSAVFFFLILMAVGMVIGLTPSHYVGVTFFLSLALDWFLTIFGISVLTTLYGHYIEGRPLV
ncbi:hypothetical protein [Falsirhodobacter halotolerans]|uniref:hypothetical protein n=1 Tax=Falsirhodobacter halotolerans TaxID=1146892 RepID=UPI001FD087A2|nr:hypothetical protein [Falsirhodobacter halotolerans]MCJ8140793.1 hypothetical protein [Falsirhodobacter halotolerans]